VTNRGRRPDARMPESYRTLGQFGYSVLPESARIAPNRAFGYSVQCVRIGPFPLSHRVQASNRPPWAGIGFSPASGGGKKSRSSPPVSRTGSIFCVREIRKKRDGSNSGNQRTSPSIRRKQRAATLRIRTSAGSIYQVVTDLPKRPNCHIRVRIQPCPRCGQVKLTNALQKFPSAWTRRSHAEQPSGTRKEIMRTAVGKISSPRIGDVSAVPLSARAGRLPPRRPSLAELEARLESKQITLNGLRKGLRLDIRKMAWDVVLPGKGVLILRTGRPRSE